MTDEEAASMPPPKRGAVGNVRDGKHEGLPVEYVGKFEGYDFVRSLDPSRFDGEPFAYFVGWIEWL